MGLQAHSQTTLTEENRVQTIVDEKGDTLVVMCYNDARILLNDVLHYEYADSLLSAYIEKDSLNTETIKLQKDVLMKMTEKKMNLEVMNQNLNEVIANKDKEIAKKDKQIKEQEREIKKQKFLKKIGLSGSVILPIIMLLALL